MPLTPEELAKLVTDYREDSEGGHTRLRQDFRIYHDQTELSLVLFRDGLTSLRSRIELLERTPPDVTKLHFSTPVVVSIVFVVVTVVGSAYGISNRVTGRLDAFTARMDKQVEDDKLERQNTAKLLEERYMRSEKQFENFGRQIELLKYEQQRLREDVTKAKGTLR